MCFFHGDGTGYGRPPIRVGSREREAEAIQAGSWGRWYWRADVEACEDCTEMDGQSFDSSDDVPERLHPNCRCEIEYQIQSQHRDKYKARHGERPGKRKRPGLWKGRRH